MPATPILYKASQCDFFREITNGEYARKMTEIAKQTRTNEAEKWSWLNNGAKVKELLEKSGVEDSYVIFEYTIPNNYQRIDCMLFGRDAAGQGQVVHIELKQWSNQGVRANTTRGNFDVEAFTGGELQTVPHPSQQARNYHGYIEDFVEAIDKGELAFYGCAYCYNYYRYGQDNCALFDSQYNDLQNQCRTYAADETDELAGLLREKLCGGKGEDIFRQFQDSPIYPSKKLLDAVAHILENPDEFSLIDDQVKAKNMILDKVWNNDARVKSVIIVKGGPGTGKTVIALHLLAVLAQKKKFPFFSTKSKSLSEGIKFRMGPRAKKFVIGLNTLIPSRKEENEVNVLLVDEAHRIEESPNHKYTKPEDWTNLSQIATLIRAARTSVFFIDDRQAIRSTEIGSSALIRECALKYNCRIEEIELTTQFRCKGSGRFLQWVEGILYEGKPEALLTQEEFEFRVFDDPRELYHTICDKDDQPNTTARLTAGFCWPWSEHTDNGELVKDIKIGTNFEMPWETHRNMKIIPKGCDEWYEWAYKPAGLKSVGCVYTAQGFEFDYIGVIIGNDLRYDPRTNRLESDKTQNCDPAFNNESAVRFDTYVRNIYRILLTRGMKGCYFYCTDPATREFFRQQLKTE